MHCQSISVTHISLNAKALFHMLMDVKTTRRRNLRQLIMEEAKAGQAHGAQARVAERIGTNPAYLSQILSEKTKAELGDRLARQIEQAFGKDHGWMDVPQRPAPSVREDSHGYVISPELGITIVSVPIVGRAIATPDQDGYFTDGDFPVGHGDGFIPWPSRDPNAYALRVKGDSMQPRIRPGEYLIVEPNRGVAPGDDVVVQLKNGRKMVKQLLLMRAGELTLGSINQAHHQVTIALEDLEGAPQFIAAIAPRTSYIRESGDGDKPDPNDDGG